MASYLRTMDEAIRAAIFNRFSNVMGIDTLTLDSAILPKQAAMRQVAEGRGRHTVEFFNVWREMLSRDMQRQRGFVSRRGMYTGYEGAGSTDITGVRAVPVGLNYSFWFWSRDLDKISSVDESYLFSRYDSSTLSLAYGEADPMDMFLSFGDIVDESDVNAMYDKGLYFVHRYPLTLEGWIFQTITNKTIKTTTLKIYDNTNGANILLTEQEIDCGECCAV